MCLCVCVRARAWQNLVMSSSQSIPPQTPPARSHGQHVHDESPPSRFPVAQRTDSYGSLSFNSLALDRDDASPMYELRVKDA